MRFPSIILAIPLLARTWAPPAGQNIGVQRVAVDRQGFVWVSGAAGTFRFDGVNFLPAAQLGLPPAGQQQVEITSDGTIWARAENMLWVLRNGRFHAFSGHGPLASPITAAGNILYTGHGRIRAWQHKDGDFFAVDGPEIHPGLLLHGEPDGTAWFGGRFLEGKPSSVKWVRFRNGAFEQGEQLINHVTLPAKQVVPAGPDSFYLAHTTLVDRLVRKPGGPFVAASQYRSTLPVGARLLAGDSREVWYEACGQWLSSQGGALQVPDAVELTRDHDGGLWAALGAKGLRYARGEIRAEPVRGWPDRPTVAVARSGDRLYVARADMTAVIDSNAKMARCDGTPSKSSELAPWGPTGADAPFSSIATAPDGTVWVLGKNQGAMQLTARSVNISHVTKLARPYNLSSLRHIAVTPDGRVWAASKENLFEVEKLPKLAYRSVFSGIRYTSGFTRTPDSQLVAIADNGLLHYEAGGWRDEKLPDCLLSQKLRTVAIVAPGERWFGYRDRPGFTHALHSDNGWACRHFEESNGFPGDTQFLARDSKGRIWRGSGAGLFVRRDSGVWAQLPIADGEMHQLFHEEPDGTILIAVGNQLLRLPADYAAPLPAAAPTPSYSVENGNVSLSPTSLAVTLGSGSILHISALTEKELAASAPIEYRFDRADWHTLSGHTLELDLAPRSATSLELRYAGASAVSTLPLSIVVPWPRSYWFWAACFALFAWLSSLAVDPIRRWRYQADKRRYVARASENPPSRIADPPLLPGTLLHRKYIVDGVIAESIFSQVYEAHDETGGRFAVKRLRMGDTPPDRIRRRFAQEIAAVNMVRHPGIVPILDAWVGEDGAPCLSMPFVDGPTLRELMRSGPVETGRSIPMLRQIAGALSAAHEQGVVHSDFKPENVLIPDSGPRIIDFGASALHFTGGPNEYSRPAGSIQYMAPEQLLGRYSKATDVYAFAAVAFEVLTGVKYAELDLPMNENWETEFLRAATADHGLPFAAATALAQALRFDPDRRSQDVSTWFAQLELAIK